MIADNGEPNQARSFVIHKQRFQEVLKWARVSLVSNFPSGRMGMDTTNTQKKQTAEGKALQSDHVFAQTTLQWTLRRDNCKGSRGIGES
jgi:hypothetical protein